MTLVELYQILKNQNYEIYDDLVSIDNERDFEDHILVDVKLSWDSNPIRMKISKENGIPNKVIQIG